MRLSTARLAGWTLLGLSLTPLHRLLSPGRAGPAGVATRASAEAAWASGLFGTLIVVGLAAILSGAGGAERVRKGVGAAGDRLCRLSPPRFAAVMAGLSGLLCGGVAITIHGGLPTSVDEMVQLLHARAIAGGHLTLGLEYAGGAWALQNGVFTDSGWASIYPPLHTLFLAVGLLTGAPWLVGPLMIGVATGLMASCFQVVLPNPRVARFAALALAVTPFWLLLGATYLSHSTAAAAVALVLWTALRAREGSWTRAIALGGAIGAAVCARPWTGLALSLAIVPTLFFAGRAAGRPWHGWRSATGILVGGAPFAGLLFWWNSNLFGRPFTLGYSRAFGPAHSLGLHTDPWGNVYGIVEAIAYTGADVVQLGAHLLESPLPVVILIASGLMLQGATRGMSVFLAWIGGGLVANALYWHHGVHMGPRMLFETVPAWVALAAGSASALMAADSGLPPRVRDAATWVVVLAAAGSILLAPGVMLAQRQSAETRLILRAPTPPATPALVFVHGSWSSRVSARLASAGMRRDSIETALRRNDICLVDTYARQYQGGVASSMSETLPPLDFDPQPGTPNGLESRSLSPGNVVRVDPTHPPSEACLAEGRADRLGSIELEALLWQSPPEAGAATIFARDLGPEANATILEGSGRAAFLYLDTPDGPRLLPYPVGIELVWGPDEPGRGIARISPRRPY